MKKPHNPSRMAPALIALALFSFSVDVWSDVPAAKENKEATSKTAEAARHKPSKMNLLKEKDKQLVMEAAEAVNETKKALDALERNLPGEALADLEVVSGKLHAVLAKDPALKEVPIDADAILLEFEGNLEAVQTTSNKAKELIENHQLQAARQLLDELASEIRISVTTLPLEAYPDAIEKTAALIVAGKTLEAKAQLYDVLNLLMTTTEVYPLPLLTAEETLTEAYRLEHTSDLAKEDSRKRVLSLADETSDQLKLAEALGYGGKDDYKPLYQGVQALKDTVHTNKFRGEWDKLHKALREFKERLVHPAKPQVKAG